MEIAPYVEESFEAPIEQEVAQKGMANTTIKKVMTSVTKEPEEYTPEDFDFVEKSIPQESSANINTNVAINLAAHNVLIKPILIVGISFEVLESKHYNSFEDES